MPSYQQRLEEIQQEPIWQEIESESGVQPKDPTVYTASTISTLDQCSYAYKLIHLDRALQEFRTPQSARGSVLHRAIDRLHRDAAWSELFDIYEYCWRDVVVTGEESSVPWRTEVEDKKLEDVKEDGAKMLYGYARKNESARVIASEVPFRMLVQHPKTGTAYRFAGTLDQIREDEEILMHNQTPGIFVPSDGSNLIVWDNKSDAQAPDSAFLERNGQLTTYGMALRNGRFFFNDEWKSFGKYPSRMVWYQLYYLLPYKRAGTRRDGSKYVKGDMRGDPVFSVERSPEDYLAFQVELCRKIQMIRMKMFVRNVTKIGCSMCKVRNACTSGKFMSETATDEEVMASL